MHALTLQLVVASLFESVSSHAPVIGLDGDFHKTVCRSSHRDEDFCLVHSKERGAQLEEEIGTPRHRHVEEYCYFWISVKEWQRADKGSNLGKPSQLLRYLSIRSSHDCRANEFSIHLFRPLRLLSRRV